MTAESTLPGYGAICADMSKTLQDVRALVKSQHSVCFWLGDGSNHSIIDKATGEIHRMRDDGVLDLIIVPPEHMKQVAAELAQIEQSKCDEANERKRAEMIAHVTTVPISPSRNERVPLPRSALAASERKGIRTEEGDDFNKFFGGGRRR